MRGKRINVTFNPNKADERRVLDYLNNSGSSSKRKAITDAIVYYLDKQEENRQSLLLEVKTIIKQSMNGESRELTIDTVSAAQTEERKRKSDEITDEFLSFFQM